MLPSKSNHNQEVSHFTVSFNDLSFDLFSAGYTVQLSKGKCSLICGHHVTAAMGIASMTGDSEIIQQTDEMCPVPKGI